MAMRKSLAVLLTAIAFVAAPIVGIAQAPTSTLRGQVVDAGGRGASDMRVELVSDRMVVATTTSTTDGHFSFPALPAGTYVVRTTVNGQPTGVRVAVTPGQPSATALLVLPSVAKASPAVILAVIGPALGSLVAVTATVVGNQLILTQNEGTDPATLAEDKIKAEAIIVVLNAQNPPPPGQPPFFAFIPTTPVSGAQ